jgi:3-phenylpropionate/trans-cinnamate dioxygenase ferredoxin component
VSTAQESGLQVCAIDDVPEGEAVVVDAERTGAADAIAVFHDECGWFALNDTCTHEEASLADGYIEDCQVECPLHTSRFSLQTGEVMNMPATEDARTHRVEVRDGAVWLFPGQPALPSTES